MITSEYQSKVLEAMAIAAHAIGARHGYIYLRKEYPAAHVSLVAAIEEAREAGVLGEIFDLEITIGQGSYVCGEETSLLNSIEHTAHCQANVSCTFSESGGRKQSADGPITAELCVDESVTNGMGRGGLIREREKGRLSNPDFGLSLFGQICSCVCMCGGP